MITRDIIIQTAFEAFRKEGVRDVTMDDIAHRLHMSKRTLYQLFHDKEELLLECLKLHIQRETAYYEEMEAKNDNVIDLLIGVMRLHLSQLQHVTPEFFDDLRRYPFVKDFFQERQAERYEKGVEFIHRGVEQGYFLPDINYHFVFQHLNTALGLSLKEAMESGMSLTDVFTHTVIIYLRGCATLRGAALLDDFRSRLKV